MRFRVGGTPVAPLGRWRESAACRDADPRRFDAVVPFDDHTRLRYRGTALRFCRDCPVIADCARHADEHEEVGLWAGVYRRSALSQCTPLITGAPVPTRARAA